MGVIIPVRTAGMVFPRVPSWYVRTQVHTYTHTRVNVPDAWFWMYFCLTASAAAYPVGCGLHGLDAAIERARVDGVDGRVCVLEKDSEVFRLGFSVLR